MIKDLNEAFEILKTIREGIPFEAIKYLRNYPASEDIINKIIFSIKNAYNSKIFYDRESDYYSSEPLWYAIIAENHLCEDLIEPVINLFLIEEGDWDFLNEQGSYLIGLLAEKYPDIAPEKVLSVIENEVKRKTKNIYLFLFDALYLLDIEKYKDKLLKILANKNMYWLDSYAVRISDMQIKEALPILKEIKSSLDEVEDIFTIRELDFAIEQLETGKIEYPKHAKPYSKQRDDWENHYKELEKCFYSDDEDDEIDDLDYDLLDDLYPDDESDTIINASPKIGRNEPCPCGSGKKYKKCCLN